MYLSLPMPRATSGRLTLEEVRSAIYLGYLLNRPAAPAPPGARGGARRGLGYLPRRFTSAIYFGNRRLQLRPARSRLFTRVVIHSAEHHRRIIRLIMHVCRCVPNSTARLKSLSRSPPGSRALGTTRRAPSPSPSPAPACREALVVVVLHFIPSPPTVSTPMHQLAAFIFLLSVLAALGGEGRRCTVGQAQDTQDIPRHAGLEPRIIAGRA